MLAAPAAAVAHLSVYCSRETEVLPSDCQRDTSDRNMVTLKSNNGKKNRYLYVVLD